MEHRTYQDMQNLFAATDDLEPGKVIYEFNNIVPHDNDEELLYGITTIYPGDVAGEFFMTKGHRHINDAAEIYYCICGSGLVYQQNAAGEAVTTVVQTGSIVYTKPGYGHRVINTGATPLKFLCVCRADAGHNYDIQFNNRFYKGCE